MNHSTVITSLNRREFTLLLALGFLKTAYADSETNFLVSLYTQYAKKYGISNSGFSFSKKTFTFEGKTTVLNTDRFCLLNYDLPSDKERFQIINADSHIELSSLASHGINTGNHVSCLFSNKDESYQSSLGIYVTGIHYVGHFGPSLNLHGVSTSNDKSFSRRIVMHGAHYCSQTHIDSYGFLGRSLGCIALPKNNMITAYQSLKPGTIVIAKMDTRRKMTEALRPPTPDEKIENRIP